MEITIQTKDGQPKFIQNASVVNGVIVTGKDGAYSPLFNRALLDAAGKTQEARNAPRVMSNKQIAQWADYMFKMGENEGGYTVSLTTPEPKTKSNKGHNSIFGVSSDLGH